MVRPRFHAYPTSRKTDPPVLSLGPTSPSWYEPYFPSFPAHNSFLTILFFKAYAQGVSHPVGVIVCKQSPHRERYLRGYIAMLSVDKGYRKRGIGTFSFSLLSPRPALLTTFTPDSVCARPTFYQCHAGWRRTRGKPHPTLLPHRPNPILVHPPTRVPSPQSRKKQKKVLSLPFPSPSFFHSPPLTPGV